VRYFSFLQGRCASLITQKKKRPNLPQVIAMCTSTKYMIIGTLLFVETQSPRLIQAL